MNRFKIMTQFLIAKCIEKIMECKTIFIKPRCVKEAIKESTPVKYWPQVCEFDMSS